MCKHIFLKLLRKIFKKENPQLDIDDLIKPIWINTHLISENIGIYKAIADNAIELNITDIVYSVGISYFGYPTYNSFECIKYIDTKLKEKNSQKFQTKNIKKSSKSKMYYFKNSLDKAKQKAGQLGKMAKEFASDVFSPLNFSIIIFIPFR